MHANRRRRAVTLFVGTALALAAAPAGNAVASPRPGRAKAVIGFVDTGINPYHRVFRDDSARAFRHPSTYIPGFPADAEALRLTLDTSNYWHAVRSDCERVWSKVKPGRAYWFPGTKIVGGITFERAAASVNCHAAKPNFGVGRILDPQGHGTMVASRGAGTQHGACRDCLIVAVQFPTSIPLFAPSESTNSAVKAIKWAARNASWIDAQSNSWGPIVPLWEPTGQAGLITSNPELARAVESVSRSHLAFWASGNGAAFRGGFVGHPSLLSPHLGPSAVIVGGHDSGYMNTWPGFSPHVVADSCASWAAYEDKIEKSGEDVGGGTSGATPFAAGGAGQLLMEARRILGDRATGVEKGVVARGRPGRVSRGPLSDGKLTLREWRTLLFKSASRRPQGQFTDGPTCSGAQWGPTPVKWSDVPDQYPEYVQIGYGAIDVESARLGARVLAGRAPMPDRSETAEYFSNDRAARAALHRVFALQP